MSRSQPRAPELQPRVVSRFHRHRRRDRGTYEPPPQKLLHTRPNRRVIEGAGSAEPMRGPIHGRCLRWDRRRVRPSPLPPSRAGAAGGRRGRMGGGRRSGRARTHSASRAGGAAALALRGAAPIAVCRRSGRVGVAPAIAGERRRVGPAQGVPRGTVRCEEASERWQATRPRDAVAPPRRCQSHGGILIVMMRHERVRRRGVRWDRWSAGGAMGSGCGAATACRACARPAAGGVPGRRSRESERDSTAGRGVHPSR